MNDRKELFKLWLFEDAPENYKKLSCHGGDEDYVIVSFIDASYDWDLNKILDRLTVCDYETHTVEEDGYRVFVYITSHG